MRTSTPWIVTGSLAALAVAGGIGAAMAGPAGDRELTTVDIQTSALPRATPDRVAPPSATDPAGVTTSALTPAPAPVPDDPGPAPVAPAAPVEVSAPSPVEVASPASATSGWSAESGG